MCEAKRPCDAIGIAFALNTTPRGRGRLTGALAALIALTACAIVAVIFEGGVVCPL